MRDGTNIFYCLGPFIAPEVHIPANWVGVGLYKNAKRLEPVRARYESLETEAGFGK